MTNRFNSKIYCPQTTCWRLVWKLIFNQTIYSRSTCCCHLKSKDTQNLSSHLNQIRTTVPWRDTSFNLNHWLWFNRHRHAFLSQGQKGEWGWQQSVDSFFTHRLVNSSLLPTPTFTVYYQSYSSTQASGKARPRWKFHLVRFNEIEW